MGIRVLHRHPANVASFDNASTADQRIRAFVAYFGSLKFIVQQTIVIVVWVILNLIAYAYRWDPYPFILLNLVFSTQAAYAAPLILMAANKQEERDRVSAEHSYAVGEQTHTLLEQLHAEHSQAAAEHSRILRELAAQKRGTGWLRS